MVEANASTAALQLLVIDLGESCVVKVERGDAKVLFAKIIVTHYEGDTAFISVPFTGFESVKASIDALGDDKPAPRIERDEFGNHYFTFYDRGDLTTVKLGLVGYGELCRLVNKELPIYEPQKGEWVKLVPPYTNCIHRVYGDELPFKAWRYSN